MSDGKSAPADYGVITLTGTAEGREAHTADEKDRLRVGIVGAGAAGLVCARELGRRGWKQVTVLEAGRSPGGRTRSLALPHPRTGRTQTIELGTHYILVGPVLRELLEETGLSHQMAEMPPAKHRRLSNPRPYHPILLRDPNLPLARRLDELKRYRIQVRNHGFLDGPGFRGLPGRGLSVSIDEWFRQNDFRFLRETMLPAVCTLLFGNGYDRVPVAYLMKLEHIRGRLPTWRNLLGQAHRVRVGNDELWRRVSRGLDVRYGHSARRVKPENGTVRVLTDDGEMAFDRLIWAADLPRLAAALSPEALTGSRTHYSQIRYLRRAVAGYRVDGLPRRILWVIPEPVLNRERNIPYAVIHWPGSDTYTFYPWLDADQTQEEMDRGVRRTIERLGARVVEQVFEPAVWDFHPFFDASLVEAGIFDQIEAEQGRDGVYVCGECVSGITLPSVTEHARQLIQRFF